MAFYGALSVTVVCRLEKVDLLVRGYDPVCYTFSDGGHPSPGFLLWKVLDHKLVPSAGRKDPRLLPVLCGVCEACVSHCRMA